MTNEQLEAHLRSHWERNRDAVLRASNLHPVLDAQKDGLSALDVAATTATFREQLRRNIDEWWANPAHAAQDQAILAVLLETGSLLDTKVEALAYGIGRRGNLAPALERYAIADYDFVSGFEGMPAVTFDFCRPLRPLRGEYVSDERGEEREVWLLEGYKPLLAAYQAFGHVALHRAVAELWASRAFHRLNIAARWHLLAQEHDDLAQTVFVMP